jgi:hypothetical protein
VELLPSTSIIPKEPSLVATLRVLVQSPNKLIAR